MSKAARIRYGSCLILSLLVLFASCEKQLNLGFEQSTAKVVLLGELTAGDTVSLRAGQSAPYSPDTTLFTLVENLHLTITDPAGATHPIQEWDDFAGQYLYTRPYGNTMLVQPGGTYTIRSQHPTLDSVTCRVAVPKPFTTAIIDTSSKKHGSVGVMQFDIELQDDPAVENYYAVEIFKQGMWINGMFFHDGFWRDIGFERALYDSLKELGPVQTQFDTTINHGLLSRLAMYTTDDLTENVKFGTTHSVYNRILLSDRTFNGSRHILKVMADKTHFASEMIQGRVVIKVKSIAREYFNYLRLAENSATTDIFSGGGMPLKLEGNVSNGLGVVGGVYLREFHYYFDDFGF